MNITPIIPKVLDVRKVTSAVTAELNNEGKLQDKVLAMTTAGWRGEKPRMIYKIFSRGEDIILFVYPDGTQKAVLKWHFLNGGTKRHPITARKAPLLKYRAGYTAGSSPGKYQTVPGYSSGPWRSAKTVMHPGIKARGWIDKLINDHTQKYIQNMQAALDKGIKAGGW